MSSIRSYFDKISLRRSIGMIIGVVLIGIGIGMFEQAKMGNSPSTAMYLSISDIIKVSLGNIIVVANLLLFVFQIIWGRRLIGFGTLINWFFVGYIGTASMWVISSVFGETQTIVVRFLWLIAAVLISSLGVSLYKVAHLGLGPYDALSVIMNEQLHWPYYICRIITDVGCAIACIMLGGMVGLGTLITAFGLGPFISFFDKKVSEKIIY